MASSLLHRALPALLHSSLEVFVDDHSDQRWDEHKLFGPRPRHCQTLPLPFLLWPFLTSAADRSANTWWTIRSRLRNAGRSSDTMELARRPCSQCLRRPAIFFSKLALVSFGLFWSIHMEPYSNASGYSAGLWPSGLMDLGCGPSEACRITKSLVLVDVYKGFLV